MTVTGRTPTIPRCCSMHRLAGLDVIETAVFNDALATFDVLVDEGWSRPDALDAVAVGLRDWLVGRIGDAVDLAAALLEEVLP